MFWTYDPIDYPDKMIGEVMDTFGIPITYPTQPGSYISNVQIVSNGQHINCWQFSYNIA